MLIPVRCFSCGKPVAEYWDDYKERVMKGESKEKALDELGIDRYCCRRMFLSQYFDEKTGAELVDEILPFKRF